MDSLAAWAESIGQRLSLRDRADATDVESTPAAPQSSLFRCPDCETVYVATLKETCVTCDATVEQVPSTLTEPE